LVGEGGGRCVDKICGVVWCSSVVFWMELEVGHRPFWGLEKMYAHEAGVLVEREILCIPFCIAYR